MEPEIVGFFVIPALIGMAIGFPVGRFQVGWLAIVMHGLLFLSIVLFALLLAGATGWDGIIWVLAIVVFGVGWIAFGLGQLVGFFIRRSKTA